MRTRQNSRSCFRAGAPDHDRRDSGLCNGAHGALGVYVLVPAASAKSAGCGELVRCGKESIGQPGIGAGDDRVDRRQFCCGCDCDAHRLSARRCCDVPGLFRDDVFRVWRAARSQQMWVWLFAIGVCQGVFALFTMYLPPLFPTLLRTTGAGFSYNIGRLAAAFGTVYFGTFSQAGDYRLALYYSAFLFIPAAAFALCCRNCRR